MFVKFFNISENRGNTFTFHINLTMADHVASVSRSAHNTCHLNPS